MTDIKTPSPSDAELDEQIRQQLLVVEGGQCAFESWADMRQPLRQFARAVLARWGTQPAGEPVACTYGDNGYACCEGGPCQAELHNERIAAPQPAPLREPTPAAMWDAFVEAWRAELGVDQIVNIMGGESKLKAVFLRAANGITANSGKGNSDG